MPPRRRIEADDLTGRTGRIWTAYVRGATQETIAADHDITQQRVSQIIAEVRDTIPEADRAHLVQRETEFLDQLRAEVLDLWRRPPIPAYSHGKPILMPDGTIAEDHSGRLAAWDRAIKAHEHLAKLLGLLAPTKADISLVGQERDATSEAAAAALAYLQGDDVDDEPGAEG
jgi:hypothetical protein